MAHMNPYPKMVYLNGEIVDAEAAKISVFDRGFLFGDGIYEVMVRINGHFFYEKAHLKRLDQCLEKINIVFDTGILPEEIGKLLKVADLVGKDCLLYIQITRGVAPRQHSYPKNTKPTLMMYAISKILPAINEVHASVITAPDFRWSRCDIKMTSLLGNVMANELAMKQGHYETILVRNGMVTEASHCNVFFVKDQVVYTHPADTFILDGITRQVTLRICHELGIEVRQQAISIADLVTMNEAFLTGTTTQIASIRQIDAHRFYERDASGKITKRIQQAFLALKERVFI